MKRKQKIRKMSNLSEKIISFKFYKPFYTAAPRQVFKEFFDLEFAAVSMKHELREYQV